MKGFKNKIILLCCIYLMAVTLFSCAKFLKTKGFHPSYDSKTYNLTEKKALIVTTSHSVLNKPGHVKGKSTGVFSSELTVPYYEFLDAKMIVDVASMKGGKIPIDPLSLKSYIKDEADKRFLKDDLLINKVENSLSIKDVNFSDYDVVFFSGGWGAAYDLGQSNLLAKKITQAYYDSNVIFGSVCHGALAFINAKDNKGNYLIKDRIMTGASQKQLKELGVTFTPKHPEEELINSGAIYKSNTASKDMYATLTVVDDERRFVTGQNQNSGHETAQEILKLLFSTKKIR